MALPRYDVSSCWELDFLAEEFRVQGQQLCDLRVGAGGCDVQLANAVRPNTAIVATLKRRMGLLPLLLFQA
jgi:hypothetical protein